MSKLHSCAECHWCRCIEDSAGDTIELCVYRQSDSYLQEVGLCAEDCELEGFAEELWCEEHGVEYQEDVE